MNIYEYRPKAWSDEYSFTWQQQQRQCYTDP